MVDKNRVFCELCKVEKKKEVGLSYCGGTTTLVNHMDTHHPVHWYEYKKELAEIQANHRMVTDQH